jgi:hypothetical protein
LFDADGFARAIEEAFRIMHRQEAPTPFAVQMP